MLFIFSDEVIESNEPIEPDREVSEIREDCFSLPGGFYWVNVNIDDDAEVGRAEGSGKT